MKLVDPESPQALADRASFYNQLRDESPVARVERGDYYILSRYQDVDDLLRRHDRYSKAWGSQLAMFEHNIGMNQDPPTFDAFRAIYAGYMSPRGVQRWSADCHRIANELIDQIEPLGAGDLQPLFGKPLPARVTAIALGLPEDQVDRYRAWTDAFLRTMIGDPEAQARVIEEMYAFFDEQIAQRREALRAAHLAQPAPEHVGGVLPGGLISVLMSARYQDRYLNDHELRRTIRGFFIGGVDTTGGLILNVLYRLLERPELWQAVQADPALVEAAIEESLRFDPPAIGMFRGAARPIEIDGETIPEGARVLYSLTGANRDPAVFEDPDTFRLDRKPGATRSLPFGAGAHFCPGAWTARLEARIALEALVRRLPKLRLTGEVTHFEVVNFWVVRSFPAAWD